MALKDPFGGSYDPSVISLPGEIWKPMPRPRTMVLHEGNFDPKYLYEISNFGRGRRTNLKTKKTVLLNPIRKRIRDRFIETFRIYGKTIEGKRLDCGYVTIDKLMAKVFPELIPTEDWLVRFFITPRYFEKLIRDHYREEELAARSPFIYCLYKEDTGEKRYFEDLADLKKQVNIPENLATDMITHNKSALGYRLYRVLRKEVEESQNG